MKKINGIKAVIFDCDGVMFDSEEANKAYYNNVLEHFHKPPMSEDEFRYTHMHTTDEGIRYLFRNDETQIANALEYNKNMDYLSLVQYMNEDPGLKPLLKDLRPDYLTAVATNRTTTMHNVLETFNLKNLFDYVVTALDVENPKPAPDMLNHILNKYNFKPEECLFIGDSKLDSQAAEQAGMVFTAFKNRELRADIHITEFHELKEYLSL